MFTSCGTFIPFSMQKENFEIKDPLVNWTKAAYADSRHEVQNPFSYFYVLQKKYGNPTIIDSKQGGYAKWKFVNGPYKEIMIRDEQIKHSIVDLYPHVDFVYVTYNYNLNKDRVPLINSYMKNVFYTLALDQVTIRCNSVEKCNAQMVAVTKINEDISNVTNISEQIPYNYALVDSENSMRYDPTANMRNLYILSKKLN